MRHKIFSLALAFSFLFPLCYSGLAGEDYEETISEVRSSVKPEAIFLQKKGVEGDKLILYLRVRWNINELKIIDMNKQSRIEFVYTERKMRLALEVKDFFPENIGKQIKDYLSNNAVTILDAAQKATLIENLLK